MEYRRGRSRKARDHEQPQDTEDQGTYDDAATREARAGGAPGGPYPQSPLYQGQELGKARPPYPVSRELLRPNQYPRPRPGKPEIGDFRAGTYSYTQPSMSREPEIGAASPVYPGVREPLRPIPGHDLRSPIESSPGAVTLDPWVTTRPLHVRPPAFQGPKIGGAQPLYPVPPPIAPRQTSCDRRCRLDNHVDHRNCNTKCKNSRHAAHLEKDRLLAEYQRRFPTVGTQT